MIAKNSYVFKWMLAISSKYIYIYIYIYIILIIFKIMIDFYLKNNTCY